MRIHITTLVKEIKNGILSQKEYYNFGQLVEDIEWALACLRIGSEAPFNEAEANSFGFIALDVIFDVKECLKADSKNEGALVTSDRYDASNTPTKSDPKSGNRDGVQA